MKAKFINEFEKNNNPKQTLDIGIHNFRDYIKSVCSEKGLSVNQFYEDLLDNQCSNFSPEEIVENMLEILLHTPLEYQLEFLKPFIDNWVWIQRENLDEPHPYIK